MFDKLTSHFDESSQCCRQHDCDLLDNWMVLVLARGRVRLMFVWQVETHCTPEKQVTMLRLTKSFTTMGPSLVITSTIFIVSNQL